MTKLDLIEYYLSVADGALRGVAGRPMILKRFVKGIAEEAVFQKRAPEKRPDWIDVAELKYASGTSAKEAVIEDAAGLAWAVNLGCVDLNPHPVRADDLEHPDELRVDLDPMPGVEWPQIVDVALVARDVLDRLRPDRVAQDLGFAWLPHLRPHRTELAIQAGAAGSRDDRARSRKARTGFGDQPVVEGRTRRRLRRLQPERQGPHRRVGVLGALATRRPGFHPAALGRGPRLPARGLHRGNGACALRRHRRPLGGHGRRGAAASRVCSRWRRNSAQPRRRRRARGAATTGTGLGRVSTMPLIEIARTKTKDEAMAALDTWKAKYPAAADRLEAVDVLVDGMRGPSSIWYRVRINLQHVPEEQRPPQEALIADYSPWEGYSGGQWRRG